jgi:hypothetical protein
MFFNLLGTITLAGEKQFPEPFGICLKGVESEGCNQEEDREYDDEHLSANSGC